jgi:HAD superfamily hydrolase (TIGR01509 family)
MSSGPRCEAVLLDFRGILIHDREPEWWIDEALKLLDRTVDPEVRAEMIGALRRMSELPDYELDETRVDTSLEVNRTIMRARLMALGFDQELSKAIHSLDFDPRSWPVYPDAAEVVREIRSHGRGTALVSDFHADVHPHLLEHGIELDAYVISFEHGWQKPDLRMFTTALDALGVDASRALMVGDRASHDGGASLVGIDTLILPAPTAFGPRGLDVLLRLL